MRQDQLTLIGFTLVQGNGECCNGTATRALQQPTSETTGHWHGNPQLKPHVEYVELSLETRSVWDVAKSAYSSLVPRSVLSELLNQAPTSTGCSNIDPHRDHDNVVCL